MEFFHPNKTGLCLRCIIIYVFVIFQQKSPLSVLTTPNKRNIMLLIVKNTIIKGDSQKRANHPQTEMPAFFRFSSQY